MKYCTYCHEWINTTLDYCPQCMFVFDLDTE